MGKGRVRQGESGEDGGAKGAEQLDSEEMEEDKEERRGGVPGGCTCTVRPAIRIHIL